MDDDKQAVLEQLRQGLKVYQDYHRSDGGYSSYAGQDNLSTDNIGSIDLSDLNCSVTWPSSPYMYSNANPSMGSTSSITGSNVFPSDTITIGNPLWPDHDGRLRLQGDQADIEINGQSLMSMIQGIQDRLNILCPDPSMEAEWDDLRALREQYEAKLAECRERSRAWQALKQNG